MHECNGAAKFVGLRRQREAPCLSSQSAPFMMCPTYRKCGTDEGQMRDLIGHFVARKGAERGAARIALGVSNEFLRRDEGADCIHALIDEDSIRAGIIADDAATGGVATGSPISIVYAGEEILDPAILEIAGAIPGFGLFD
jgi:hypothetical protein